MEIKRTGVQRKFLFSELKKGPSTSGVVRLADGHFYTIKDLFNVKFQIVEASVLVDSE